MKKTILVVLFIISVLTITSCERSISQETITAASSTAPKISAKEKVINYIENSGVACDLGICVSFQDFLFDKYRTYFIIYNTAYDSFELHQYTADQYFNTPPKFTDADCSVTINLSNGEVMYYTNVRGSVYTGTAFLEVATYGSNAEELTDIVIMGEHEELFETISDTFEISVQNTITYINLFLQEDPKNISVTDLGLLGYSN